MAFYARAEWKAKAAESHPFRPVFVFLSKRRDLLGKPTGLDFGSKTLYFTEDTTDHSFLRKSKERGANEKGQRNDLKAFKVYKVYPGEYFES